MKEIKAAFRLTNDGDAWGNTMSWLFAICDVLCSKDSCPPDHWNWRPGAAGPLTPDSPDWDLTHELASDFDVDTLIRFGNVLNRYSDCLRRAGRDY